MVTLTVSLSMRSKRLAIDISTKSVSHRGTRIPTELIISTVKYFASHNRVPSSVLSPDVEIRFIHHAAKWGRCQGLDIVGLGVGVG